jgi:hypothetical protein
MMSGSEIISKIEEAGGQFIVDEPNRRILFKRGRTPNSLLAAFEREKGRVILIVAAREYLAKWEPRKGVRLQ